MLERQHLSIIREIGRRGTVTRAAEALHLTQSAVSHAIKKLELQIGTPLWEKHGRTLHLSQAGQHLLGLANRLLPQFEHTEALLLQYAEGQRGTLRIGMECHPCYQWLLKVVSPFLRNWPGVDVDVRQQFQFGGIGALFSYEIELLITPDPLFKAGLSFTPVFDYEQVLVVNPDHPLAGAPHVTPEDLATETLITYPVEPERLDIFNQFLLPANHTPRRHRTIETTDIMLQMVAAGRGVAALPGWLVEEYRGRMPLTPVRLGRQGIHKQIFIGTREADAEVEFIAGFIALAQALH